MKIVNASPVDHPECRPAGCDCVRMGPTSEYTGPEFARHFDGVVADVLLVPVHQVQAVEALGLHVRVLGVRFGQGGAVEFVDRAGTVQALETEAAPKRKKTAPVEG